MASITQPLYGGAITTVIPAGLLDASTVRQVPDTQEVFLSQQGEDDTLIIELMERLEGPDTNAITEHLGEIANLNDVGGTEWRLLETQKVACAYLNAGASVSVATEPARKWGRDGELSPTLVLVFGLIRLEEFSTDVLVTLNMVFKTPSELAALASMGEAVSGDEALRVAEARLVKGRALVSMAVEKMKVVHKDLFG